jgi:hypothetical protein
VITKYLRSSPQMVGRTNRVKTRRGFELIAAAKRAA